MKVSGLESGAYWRYSTDAGQHWTWGSGAEIASSVFGADGLKDLQVQQVDAAGNYGGTQSLQFTLNSAVI
ncbi:hypothetical protein ACQ859_08650 [Roseateles chitinivorans]|uniref:hypothetical protein n=1 Tax=Roseateles chitinivorans TaxID=2917965 RepID=UPI003D6651EA